MTRFHYLYLINNYMEVQTMDKKLFHYHYHPTQSPLDFLNLVFEVDDDEVTKVHIYYCRDEKLLRLWTYDPNKGSMKDYEEGDDKFAEIFTHSSAILQKELCNYEIKWYKDANSWEGEIISLDAFVMRLANCMDTDRPLWVISVFTKYLYDQTQDYIEWLREEQPDQEYMVPTNISKVNQWVYRISIPCIKDDRLYEMIDELLYEESDFYYQYSFIVDNGQEMIEVRIEV